MTIRVKNLSIAFGAAQILSNVNLVLHPSKVTGLIGRSGCGKSTLAKAMTGIIPVPKNSLFMNGQNFQPQLSKTGHLIHYMWQDPFAALSPFLNALDIICEPLKAIHKLPRAERLEAAQNLLQMVGLEQHCEKKRPHQLSGGQCQRIALARALAVKPKYLILDEPLSALDLVTQEKVVSLIRDIRKKLNLGILIISHDLQTLAQLADEIVVMDNGEVVEHQPAKDFFDTPQHALSKKFVEISRSTSRSS
ncbi:dipeptide/oligopeptide/nickel ABC transporter ATP-binding protein [Pseudovibrio sp. Tun.PSC04-5.I4]|uniref:ABC transporter ATP-binding protein n=1 Tax=Pseudovibrio sp. Tun.PSC04-5.I4 TaxID=1798213 RepID=UPI0008897A44|nr:dipeptide/oligopeptide/nickel ABC transporter ATP-binding protein [Pseudovibrio sp. Tun.PSC04-5.I4]SDQ12885.1 peptide/nickel transport system ATP-binding protein [Pseudovibrio sp. Tun.PSC04-5.I4]